MGQVFSTQDNIVGGLFGNDTKGSGRWKAEEQETSRCSDMSTGRGVISFPPRILSTLDLHIIRQPPSPHRICLRQRSVVRYNLKYIPIVLRRRALRDTSDKVVSPGIE